MGARRLARCRGLIALGLSLALAACAAPRSPAAPAASGAASGEPSASAPGAAPTAVPAPVKIRLVGVTASAVIMPVYVAIDDGLYARQGLEVEYTALPAVQSVQAMIAGDAPLGIVGSSLLGAYQQGNRDLIHVGGIINGATHKVVSQPGLSSVQDLRGRSVGVTQVSSTSGTAFRLLARKYGLDAERDVRMVPLREDSGIIGGLSTGAIDAGVLQVHTTQLALDLGLHLLVDLTAENLPVLGVNVVTLRSWAAGNGPTLEAFMRAHVQSIASIHADPDHALASFARWTRTDDPAAIEANRFLTGRMSAEFDPAILAVALDLEPELAALNLKAADFVDLRYLQAAQASLNR